MTKNKGTKLKLLEGEKFIYFILALLIVSAPMLSVFTKATLSQTSIEVETLKSQVEKQSNINEGLSMQINELASLDKVQEVAKNLGLSYNDDNVKVIADK